MKARIMFLLTAFLMLFSVNVNAQNENRFKIPVAVKFLIYKQIYCGYAKW